MNRNVAIAALGGAVLLLVGAFLWSSDPAEPTAAPQPDEPLQAAEAATQPTPEAQPELVAPAGRPIPAGVIDISPEERARRAALVRERIKKLTAEQRGELRGGLPDPHSPTGGPLSEAGPTPDPE